MIWLLLLLLLVVVVVVVVGAVALPFADSIGAFNEGNLIHLCHALGLLRHL